MTITNVAVIGAGSMGAGIAALAASAGLDVILFDVTRAGAQRGIDLQVKRKGFYHPSHVANIRAASTEDDLELLADRDWVVEAIFEDLDAKHTLYAKVAPHLAPHAILSSNTSTLPLARLREGVAAPERFAITHFFNPPKVMRLVELVAPHAPTERALRECLEQTLGKVALACRDTPGFIANRVGCYWMAAGVAAARRHQVSIELADAAASRPFGIPRTGVFGLLDYIGLQLVEHVWGSLEAALPEGDRLFEVPLGGDEFIAGLVSRGLTGRTGEGGFYRGRDETVTQDYSYRPRENVSVPQDARELMDSDTPEGRFARELFLSTLRYCCEVTEEIADHVGLIDAGLRLGFGWKKGIFELADTLGRPWLLSAYASTAEGAPALLEAADDGFYPRPGYAVDHRGQPVEIARPAGAVTLAGLLDAGAETLLETDSGALHAVDVDGVRVGIIDLHTPLNSLPTPALAFMRQVLDAVRDGGIGKLEALVIGNDEARAFCAGAHLPTIAAAARSGDADAVHQLIHDGSATLRAVRRAPVPVVGAVRGAALGGGCELALSCDRLVVHADAALGFPERHVGLFPGWTGTVSYLERVLSAGGSHQDAFDVIAGASPAANAFHARDLHLLRAEDEICFSTDHVLGTALSVAAELARAGYTAPADPVLPLHSGPALDAAWPVDGATATDAAIVAQLARVYTAADDDPAQLDFDQLCEREVDLDVPTLLIPACVERAEHMAATRRPLGN
ncbi:enoyl-CoA hydratase/isomerase family protein [Corynebacterium lizhenjunii]|uniref:Enoyl-CoA hydratase/isomerase family protein n=1 Tax=Corynebacterium lizhenjunii TaxID=2709394 RepID=A0A7T0PB08_9CORY|nr:3-hydroxyacyl-CoA dehydrogenase/enoyl-CoA hydratase family protein [Corynebacterium lizhenjunii]QPK79666.1 enoyl-CoA hydratase/isomerase family protein [Corynebacterium lizhenjunii]